MSLPDRIRIAWEPPHGHTDTIGRYADGQFFLGFHGARTGDPMIEGPFRDERRLRWLVYLHLFDHDGTHMSTTVKVISTTSERMTDAERAQGDAEVASLLETLPDMSFGEIEIRPFRVDLDDIVFGLIDESDDERGPWAELYPDGLGFAPPWDGLYST